MANIPRIIYGTAWKKEKTTDLVKAAVLAGFRAIDTACQPKHYREDLVGQAIKELQEQGIQRSDLFIQTKFTSIDGQDTSQPLPYDPHLPLPDQVFASFQTSQKNLGTEYVDSLVLHSPLRSHSDTMLVWNAFEKLYKDGKVKHLGISNIYNLDRLKMIWEDSNIKPTFVQNRFYADSGYDVDIRAFLKDKNARYQSFWTLTANPHILNTPEMAKISQQTRVGDSGSLATSAQIFFKYLMQRHNIIPLTGTTNKEHMVQDLLCANTNNNESFSLSPEQIAAIDRLFVNKN
eukprot:TRINITY_DN20565_c0_g1_i2.p1 TRINITY_DN20565_c0_g1~~TRINITY_DN20565_c0_g1_i2.p1  ORF type:complete len:290 (+),score=76.66 TRINITY_DN20565_c0_g1_i2:195-1064(+)